MYTGLHVIKNGLIFGYDTNYGVADNGLSTRFYKGRPTTNISANHHASGHNSGNYGNVVTVVDAPEKGDRWKKVTISNRGNNFRIVQWQYTSHTSDVVYSHSAEFDWGNMRGKGYSMPFDGNGGGTRNYYRNKNYSSNGGTSIDVSLKNGHFASNIVKSGTHVHAWFIYHSTTGVSGLNDYFYYRDYQVEVSTTASPYTSSTRSNTQGLIDLTKAVNIDMSTMSYTSLGQPTFDGTDDGISLGDDSRFDFTNGVMSVEAVVYFPSSWTGGSQYPNLISKGASAGWDTNGWALFGFRDWGGDKSWGFGMRNGSTTRITSRQDVAEDVYWHIVATLDGTTIRLYENGVQVATNTQTINPASNSTNVYLGRGPSSQYFPGDMPVSRVYNRTLSAEEIKTNFLAYSRRFNI